MTKKSLQELFKFAGKNTFKDYEAQHSPQLKKWNDVVDLFNYMKQYYFKTH